MMSLGFALIPAYSEKDFLALEQAGTLLKACTELASAQPKEAKGRSRSTIGDEGRVPCLIMYTYMG